MKPTWTDKAASQKPPLLKWKPMKDFPGEFYALIGQLEFSVSDEGHWDVSYIAKHAGLRCRTYITLESGKTISLKRAKMKCERFARTLHTAFKKLK